MTAAREPITSFRELCNTKLNQNKKKNIAERHSEGSELDSLASIRMTFRFPNVFSTSTETLQRTRLAHLQPATLQHHSFPMCPELLCKLWSSLLSVTKINYLINRVNTHGCSATICWMGLAFGGTAAGCLGYVSRGPAAKRSSVLITAQGAL